MYIKRAIEKTIKKMGSLDLKYKKAFEKHRFNDAFFKAFFT